MLYPALAVFLCIAGTLGFAWLSFADLPMRAPCSPPLFFAALSRLCSEVAGHALTPLAKGVAAAALAAGALYATHTARLLLVTGALAAALVLAHAALHAALAPAPAAADPAVGARRPAR